MKKAQVRKIPVKKKPKLEKLDGDYGNQLALARTMGFRTAYCKSILRSEKKGYTEVYILKECQQSAKDHNEPFHRERCLRAYRQSVTDHSH